ncbi:septum formation protein [Microlunatus sagamiharensis]|uniref:Nucleoside triphosphate pyrophosphatase n=1 Tax=Microlunatus sagamiharensis TaxID=546874 RepID=A0A1H2LL99_9ACTN|nr:nucleoside triphosphate pyrophosphatase [Microlunatus sagamiharensis]SDU81525.1 septum formation protein [Microlunatus sagamiharensis]
MSATDVVADRVRLVLASASPARLATLRAAGLDPEVVVSGVDESGVTAEQPAALVAELARLKAEAVDATLVLDDRVTVLVGCDSMLELDGQAYGKPHDPASAVERWGRMRGRSGVLHTGHHVLVHARGERLVRAEVGSTTVHFADLDDDEVAAYVATGEPLEVAGSFTVDGLGGAFVERIEGDHHNVVGISLPLLRTVLRSLGVRWSDLWTTSTP